MDNNESKIIDSDDELDEFENLIYSPKWGPVTNFLCFKAIPFDKNSDSLIKLKSSDMSDVFKRVTIMKHEEDTHFVIEKLDKLKETLNGTFELNGGEIYEKEIDFAKIEANLKQEFESKYKCLVLFLFVNGSQDVCRNKLAKFLFSDCKNTKTRLIFVLGSSDANVMYDEMLNKSNLKADFLLFYSKNISATVEALCTQTFNSTNYDLMTRLKMAKKELMDNKKVEENPFIISTLTETIDFSDTSNFGNYPDERYSISAIKNRILRKIGKCVIFNFEEFDIQNYTDREGSQNDVRSLVATFGQLNFDISVYHNLNSYELVPKLQNELDQIYEKNYDCFAICLLTNGCYGKLLCRDAKMIELAELVELVAVNESLCGKPKLFFVQTSQKLSRTLPKPFGNYPDLFIFYSAYIGQQSYRNPKNGTWFIQTLSRVLQKHASEFDMETIAAIVTNSVVEFSIKSNEEFPDEAKSIFQNPCLYSTLTKPLIFAFDEEELREQPGRGRCLILCFDDRSYYNTFDVAASFVNKNYYCKTLRNMSKDKIKNILQKELENDITNCNNFVLSIYANKCNDQGFQIYEDNRTQQYSLKNWLKELKKYKDKKIPFNIFINPISRNDHESYFQQEGNISFFYNSFSLNWDKESIKFKNCKMIEKCIKTIGIEPDEYDLKYLKSQFSCIYDASNEWTNDDYTGSYYAGNEDKTSRCVIIASEQNELTDQLEETFKALKFEVVIKSTNSRTEIENFLYNESKCQKGYNCFALFVLANCSNNEIILEKDENLNMQNILHYFDEDNCPALKEYPKLFLIQDLMQSSRYNLEISEDCLLTIVGKNSSFLSTFCKIAKDHCQEYDLLSLIHATRLITMIQDKSESISFEIKSKLTKQVYLNKLPWMLNQDYIKSDALFYRDGCRKCVIFRHLGSIHEETNVIVNYLQLLIEKTFQKHTNNPVTNLWVDEIEYFNYKRIEGGNTYEYLFMFVFVESKTDADIVKKLIKYLSGVQQLWGKPKVIFLLGSYKLGNKFKLETKSDYAKMPVNGYRIATYSDFLLFQSKDVQYTVETLCTLINDPNISYDLVTILSMISNKKMKKINQKILPGFIAKNFYAIFPSLTPETPVAVSNTNSTLTRLISMKSPIDRNFTLNQDITYVLPKKDRGLCLIFNHFKFMKVGPSEIEYDTDKTRLGTEYDAKALQKTFKNLKLEVTKEDDFTREQILDKIKNIDGTKIQCLVVCFLSHGKKYGNLRCFDKPVNVDDLIELIANNPKLVGKPKFLIIQACRGKNYDYGNETKVVADGGFKMVNSTVSPQSKYSDIFVFWSNFEGYISTRNKDKGSPFIQTLCQELENNCEKYDFATIASIVSRKVSQQTLRCNGRNTKQIPTFYSTLNQPVLFSKV